MALLKMVEPEQAEGVVKQAYDQVSGAVGVVPMPMRMFSISPPHLKTMLINMSHYFEHPALGATLQTQIRLMSAAKCDHPFCKAFNREMLKKMAGLSDGQVADFLADPTSIPTSEKDKAMLGFVAKAIDDPDGVEAADIDQLKSLGWEESHIFDALAMATSMISSSILFRAFKIDA